MKKGLFILLSPLLAGILQLTAIIVAVIAILLFIASAALVPASILYLTVKGTVNIFKNKRAGVAPPALS